MGLRGNAWGAGSGGRLGFLGIAHDRADIAVDNASVSLFIAGSCDTGDQRVECGFGEFGDCLAGSLGDAVAAGSLD